MSRCVCGVRAHAHVHCGYRCDVLPKHGHTCVHALVPTHSSGKGQEGCSLASNIVPSLDPSVEKDRQADKGVRTSQKRISGLERA